MGALPELPARSRQLVAQLQRTSWPASLDAGGGSGGLPVPVVREYAGRWSEWLQQHPASPAGVHNRISIAKDEVHLAHFSGVGKSPILLLHGWPTSFLAFHRILQPLRDLASDVVLATLPGFGLSPPPKRGMAVGVLADLLLEAMSRRGFDRFVVHGQDWGSTIARVMGLSAPHRIQGVHVSAGLHGFMTGPDADADADVAARKLRSFAVDGAGYLQLQSRRPDSLAVALTDSPAGLLAWQLDKYQLWQAALGEDFGLGEDFIFGNATLYWATNAIGTSMRAYAANRDLAEDEASLVPTGVSVFGAADFASKPVAARHNNLVVWSEHAVGGHVAALDAPAQFVADLSKFLDQIGAR